MWLPPWPLEGGTAAQGALPTAHCSRGRRGARPQASALTHLAVPCEEQLPVRGDVGVPELQQRHQLWGARERGGGRVVGDPGSRWALPAPHANKNASVPPRAGSARGRRAAGRGSGATGPDARPGSSRRSQPVLRDGRRSSSSTSVSASPPREQWWRWHLPGRGVASTEGPDAGRVPGGGGRETGGGGWRRWGLLGGALRHPAPTPR